MFNDIFNNKAAACFWKLHECNLVYLQAYIKIIKMLFLGCIVATEPLDASVTSILDKTAT